MRRKIIILATATIALAIVIAGILPIMFPLELDERVFYTARRMDTIQSALDEFRERCGKYPSTDEGLKSLISDSSWCTAWNEKSLFEKRIGITDHTGSEFHYISNSVTYQLSSTGNPKLEATDSKHALGEKKAE